MLTRYSDFAILVLLCTTAGLECLEYLQRIRTSTGDTLLSAGPWHSTSSGLGSNHRGPV